MVNTKFRGLSLENYNHIKNTGLEVRDEDFYYGTAFINESGSYSLQNCPVNIVSDTVGQLIIDDIYEGDVFEHPDYRNVLFEFQWSSMNLGWVPKVIFGNSIIFCYKSPSKIYKDYIKTGLPVFFREWYPKDNPRYDDTLGYGVFIGIDPKLDLDIYYDSSMGLSGEIYGIGQNNSITKFGEFSNKGVSSALPWVEKNLKDRMFI